MWTSDPRSAPLRPAWNAAFISHEYFHAMNVKRLHITDLQTKQPGRLVQTIEQASSQMFERLAADKKVDYYVKGPVVGLVLDAHIRRLTNGKRSMDDVIRLEYKRWSGEHGYTGAQFNQTVSDAAGVDVSDLRPQRFHWADWAN